MTSKVALITGAARGIGEAIATRFAAEGFTKLVIVDKDQDTLEATRKRLQDSFPQVDFVSLWCDVGSPKAVAAALDSLTSSVESIQVLVNNAGYGGPFHRIDEVSDQEWHDIFATNVGGVFYFSRALLPHMKGGGFGRIINTASIQGFLGAKRSSTYVAAKHAVIGYTRSIAAEWGEYGINCNAICPGYIDTAMGVQDDHSLDHALQVRAKTPCQRLGKPKEVADLALFLSAPQSSFVNGAIYTIDGGFSAHIGV